MYIDDEKLLLQTKVEKIDTKLIPTRKESDSFFQDFLMFHSRQDFTLLSLKKTNKQTNKINKH